MKTGAELIAEERQQQISREGWTTEYDDGHSDGEMAKAAVCYVNSAVANRYAGRKSWPLRWPWGDGWWKPTTQIRDLTKAGALIAAEIDRLQRLEGGES